MSEETGRISKWNEATFKSMRLHEIQETINSLRVNPLAITDGKFNYIWIAQNVDILYGEGYSKYSKTERDDVDKTREILFKALGKISPTKILNNRTMGGSSKTYVVDEELFHKLMDLILIFERKVKDYNDQHGLTTFNEEEMGGWD